MARTKQTACKSDSKGKLTQVTFDQPSTESDGTSTMDKPEQAPTDIDLIQGTQPHTAKPHGKPPVDPEATTQAPQLPVKADQEEEEIVELDVAVEGDTEGKAGPSTSTTSSIITTHKCKHDNDEDKESRRYMAQSRAAAEAWKKAVTETDDANVAKAAYNTLCNTLYQQVLKKQPSFTVALKYKVLDSISKQDRLYMTGDDANVFYAKRIGEEPGKSVVNRKEEQEIKDAVVAVHDTALQACDGLRKVHSALGNLAKVAPLDMHMSIVRAQQIPNVNVVIKVAQAVPDQPTYGDMITPYHLPTPSKVANETEATRQMAAFMYFTLYNMIMHKPISQENCATLFKVQYSSFRGTVSGRKQPGGSQTMKEKKLKALAKSKGTPTSPMTRSQTGASKGSTPKSSRGRGKGGKK